jgi:hypothetical protein
MLCPEAVVRLHEPEAAQIAQAQKMNSWQVKIVTI